MRFQYASQKFLALDQAEQELRLAIARNDPNVHQYLLMVCIARSR